MHEGPLKRRLNSVRLHGVTPQKTTIFKIEIAQVGYRIFQGIDKTTASFNTAEFHYDT
jgi:hypothetical protein